MVHFLILNSSNLYLQFNANISAKHVLVVAVVCACVCVGVGDWLCVVCVCVYVCMNLVPGALEHPREVSMYGTYVKVDISEIFDTRVCFYCVITIHSNNVFLRLGAIRTFVSWVISCLTPSARHQRGESRFNWRPALGLVIYELLTHWSRGKMATVLQTRYSNHFRACQSFL